ncbi:hypothetical protein [Bacteroides cellulosilyticus]|uniref:hypothetical protein n=1 Tax=Bacteroides cellulosilyticus TaxID=246787 RepID=UPI003568E31B
MQTPKKANKKSMVIDRRSANKTESTQHQSLPPTSNNSGIILASSTQVPEKDPFKVELINKGYKIVSENDYGAIVRKATGKPSFLARTANGYFEELKPNSLFLPKSIYTAMKTHIASMNINAQQYLTQLVLKDLKENNRI